MAKRRGGGHTGRAVAVGVVGVVFALGTAFAVAWLASRGHIEVRLGDDRFDVGDASDRLERITADGQPILFQDPATGRRPIYVDNPGTEPDSGWLALGAVVPDAPGCIVVWTPQADAYVVDASRSAAGSSCPDGKSFPRRGTGLRSFPIEVVDGRLFIDLQDAER